MDTDDSNAFDYTTRYTFDAASNRVEKATAPGSGQQPNEVTTYTYDANDRLLTESLDNTVDNDKDRYTLYEYGPNADPESGGGGDGTEQTRKAVYEGLTSAGTKLEDDTYEYNLQGRLWVATTRKYDDVQDTVITETTNSYDHTGIRFRSEVRSGDDANENSTLDVGEVTSHVQTDYLIDPSNMTGYAQVIEQIKYDVLDAMAVRETLTYTLGRDVIAQARNSGPAQFFLCDTHGSTRALLDAMGAMITSPSLQLFTYDAYGNPLNFTLADALTTLLYSGELTDAATGLQYLRARFYNPRIGRFNQLDLFAGHINDPLSFHKYLYAHGNPVLGIDPFGLFTLLDLIGATAVRSRLVLTKLYPTLEVYDKVDTAREAMQLLGGIVRSGSFDVISASLLLAEFLPLGKMASRIGNVFRKLPTGVIDDTINGGKEILEDLTRMYARAGGRGAKDAAELVGIQAATSVAIAKGMKATDFKAGYHGVDGLFKDPDGFWVVVEAKGGSSPLAQGQMSRNWIESRIQRIVEASQNAHVPNDVKQSLLTGLNENRIRGMVVSAPINTAGYVTKVDFEIKDIVNIPQTTWSTP